MDTKSIYFPVVFAVLFLLVAPAVWADPEVICADSFTEDSFTVSCDTLPLITLRPGNHVRVPLGPTPGSVIHCNFDMNEGDVPASQSFAVQPTTVGGVECALDSCVWTVTTTGFYVLDTISGNQVLGYPWIQ